MNFSFENPSKKQDRSPKNETETTKLGDTIYNVDKLKEYAKEIRNEMLRTEELKDSVAEGNYYWEDKNGEKLSPFQILSALRENSGSWNEVKTRYPAWSDHLDSIARAKFNNPIWITNDGFVFDGMHRLTRAFGDGKMEIVVKVFDSSTLPTDAIIKEKEE